MDGSSSFYGASATPIYIYEEESKSAEVAWIPSSGNPESGTLQVTINDPNFPEDIPLIGNNCEETQHEDWDEDGDGWRSCLGDCDDTNPDVNPGAEEIVNNRDDNCNGEKDEVLDPNEDLDFDGYSLYEGDCLEGDPNVSPDIEEIPNGIDDNCDGIIDNNTDRYDDDGDGMNELEGDCDDSNPNVHPDQDEIENELDDNCNGFVDEGSDSFDDDKDGFAEIDGDCNDADPWVWPGNIEDCDGLDNDCDDEIDEVDEEDGGGCSFVVERENTVIEPSGCSTSGGSGFIGLGLIGLLLGRSRQRFSP